VSDLVRNVRMVVHCCLSILLLLFICDRI
jgi:hypothetical protein